MILQYLVESTTDHQSRDESNFPSYLQHLTHSHYHNTPKALSVGTIITLLVSTGRVSHSKKPAIPIGNAKVKIIFKRNYDSIIRSLDNAPSTTWTLLFQIPLPEKSSAAKLDSIVCSKQTWLAP
jgi:hypothetical protein